MLTGSLAAKVLGSSLCRYLVVGGAAAVVEYGSFLGFMRSTVLSYLVAHALSVYAGFLFSFFANKFWSFSNREAWASQFLGANLLLAFNLVATSFLLHALVEYAGLVPAISKLVCMAAVVIWNFLLFRNVIFRPRKTRSAP